MSNNYNPAEIQKFAQIGKIKKEVIVLMEMAPELQLEQIMQFVQGLVEREFAIVPDCSPAGEPM